MGIMDMFRSAPQVQAQVSAQNTNQFPGTGQPGNIPPQNTPVTAVSSRTDPNGTVPANASADPATLQTPLDKFNDLFKIDPNANPQNSNTPIFNIDPQKMMEAAGKVNFAQVVTPESLQAIQGGGEAAATAFAEALNKVAQQVYAQSAIASTQLIEKALGKARENFTAEIPSLIKAQNLTESLRNENPAFAHPAAQPVVSMIQENLRLKNPNATVQELQDLTRQYFNTLGAAFAQQPIATSTQSKSDEIDWENFLTN